MRVKGLGLRLALRDSQELFRNLGGVMGSPINVNP